MFLKYLEEDKIIAVLRAETPQKCIEYAKECFEGGIRILEITFTVPEAEKVIKALKQEIKGAVIGAGTILTKEQCKKAEDAGAEFIVSPHLGEDISKTTKVIYIPGIMTPTEYIKAKSLGCDIVKVFPGNVLKPSFVKSMKGPFPEFKAIPTGGVTIDNLHEWFKAGVIAVGVGSAITKSQNIKETAKMFVQKIKEVSK